jgi:hypothetical protein
LECLCSNLNYIRGIKISSVFQIALDILAFLLEFKGNIDVFKTMNVLTDILIWIAIAVPTIYFIIKKDVRKLAMVLVIPIIFILM